MLCKNLPAFLTPVTGADFCIYAAEFDSHMKNEEKSHIIYKRQINNRKERNQEKIHCLF